MKNQNSKIVNLITQIVFFSLLTNHVFATYAGDIVSEVHPQEQKEQHKMGTDFRPRTK